MPDVALLKRADLAALTFFLEEGKVVDGVTVGPTAAGKPDLLNGSSESNWPTLGAVQRAQPGQVTAPRTYNKALPRGVWRTITENIVTGDYIDIEPNEHNELILRNVFGIDEIVEDVEQVPFSNAVREMTGWLKVQGRLMGKNGGQDLLRWDMWCTMRVLSSPPWSPQSGNPVMRFEHEGADSGETILFPSAA